jgi:hypothetical protein
MNTLARMIHPLFSWAGFLLYGLEAIREVDFLLMVLVALGLGGLSQGYWKAFLGEHRPFKKADLISFYVGLIPAFLYPLLAIWSFFFKH